MSKLQELINTFKNDERWNTVNRDGSRRFDKEIAWIESMVRDYADKLKMPVDRVVELTEARRDYSWPNYYQPANFPPIDSDNIFGVFETAEAFKEHIQQNYKGFKCPRCGNVGNNPQECDHRIAKDGVCDWTSYGLCKTGISVIILAAGVTPIPFFAPEPKEKPPVPAGTDTGEKK